MPYMKAIAGHTKTGGRKNVGPYLYYGRDGVYRPLAVSTINVPEDCKGQPWYEFMDNTRELAGNDVSLNGGKVRTYNHYIISLDPKDDVAPDVFMDYVREWACAWFDDDGEHSIGCFEVGIVLHDDNKESAARGEGGKLHAHVIVNNTEMHTRTRLSPKLTNRVVQRMRADLEHRAYALGWHSFSETGESMTPAEMQAAGTAPTPTRGEAIRKLLLREDHGNLEAGQEPALDAGAEGEPAGSRGPSRAGRLKTKTIRHWIDLGDGRIAIAPESIFETRQPRRETMEERQLRMRRGWSWKDDIRKRLDLAIKISRSVADLNALLATMGVGVSFAADGEIKFSSAASNGREVRGSTLGAGYSVSALRDRLAKRAMATVKMGPEPGSGASLNRGQRSAIGRAASRIPGGSREDAERLDAVSDLVDAIEGEGAGYYDQLADEAQRELAESIGVFDKDGSGGPGDEVLRWRIERAKRGEGGTEATAGEGSPSPAAQGDPQADAKSRDREDR